MRCDATGTSFEIDEGKNSPAFYLLPRLYDLSWGRCPTGRPTYLLGGLDLKVRAVRFLPLASALVFVGRREDEQPATLQAMQL